MPFTTPAFALFCLLLFIARHFGPRRSRHLVLLAASVVYCAIASLPSLFPLLLVVPLGYWTGLWLERLSAPRVRLTLLAAALAVVVSCLFGPKLVASLSPSPASLSTGFSTGLLGVSFFTLKVVGYLIDVYWARIPAERDFGIFATYVALVLELPAGPIDRAQALLPQLRDPRCFDEKLASHGLRLVLWGLFKKLVVADRLAVFVAVAYDNPQTLPGVSLVVATIAFAFQLFADFSAYSDMAVGLGHCLGLRLAQNFDAPYSSTAVRRFWTRWHISFSTWLRDYVFLPLNYRWARRLEGRSFLGFSGEHWSYAGACGITMALAGLWHGICVNYLLWGAAMAALMVTSIFTLKLRARSVKRLRLRRVPKLYKGSQIFLTFAAICATWVFFRSDRPGSALHILAAGATGIGGYTRDLLARVGGAGHSDLLSPLLLRQSWPDGCLAVVCTLLMLGVETLRGRDGRSSLVAGRPAWLRWATYSLTLMLTLLLRAPGGQRFLYAGF